MGNTTSGSMTTNQVEISTELTGDYDPYAPMDADTDNVLI